MSTPRIAARRLALLLFLPACQTWRPVTLAPHTGYQRDGSVRVERKVRSTDSLVVRAGGSAGTSRAPVVFNLAWVDGDSLFGVRSGSAQPVAMAVADVQQAEERRFSGWRTTFLVVGGLVGGLVGLMALMLGTAGY